MVEKNKLMIRRIIGVLFVALGLIVFAFLSPIVVAQGMFAELASIWLMTGCIAAGSLLIAGIASKRIIRALAIGFALFLPWSAILFIPLPCDTEFLVAVLVLFVGLLLYRQYHKHTSSQKPRSEQAELALI